ncbi:MAG: hypothetical protein WC662_00870 [Candidatus Paceibacterota bacterium]|jgi:hypothetical protein
MITRIKNNQNGGFISIIILIIIIIFIFYFLTTTPTGIYFWNSFTDNFGRMSAGELNDVQLAAPMVDISNMPY